MVFQNKYFMFNVRQEVTWDKLHDNKYCDLIKIAAHELGYQDAGNNT